MPIYDVLIVNGSAAVRKILHRVLRQADVPVRSVFEAASQAEVLETLETREIGMILSEANMPRSGVLDLLSRVRGDENWKTLSVVMAATFDGEAEDLNTLELGVSRHVRRPTVGESR